LSRFTIVNPDVIVANNFVQACEDALIQYPTTIIAGKIYYAPRYEYHSERVPKHSFQLDEHGGCFPLPSDYPYSIWYAGGQIDWAHATTKHIGVDDLDHPMYDESGETDFATGCCMVYDKSVSDRVGLWDEGYFMYYEDADFCVRAKRAHISTRYIPSIRLWHKNAQSTGGSGSDFHVRAMRSARLRFGLKYAPTRTKLHLLKNIIFPRLGS
jgi:GT2 family glycosyltransferase